MSIGIPYGPSFWREGIMLCFSVALYMLVLLGPTNSNSWAVSLRFSDHTPYCVKVVPVATPGEEHKDKCVMSTVPARWCKCYFGRNEIAWGYMNCLRWASHTKMLVFWTVSLGCTQLFLLPFRHHWMIESFWGDHKLPVNQAGHWRLYTISR